MRFVEKRGSLVSVEGVEPEILDAYAFAQMALEEWSDLRLPTRTAEEFRRRERVALLVRSTAQALERLLAMVDLGPLQPVPTSQRTRSSGRSAK